VNSRRSWHASGASCSVVNPGHQRRELKHLPARYPDLDVRIDLGRPHRRGPQPLVLNPADMCVANERHIMQQWLIAAIRGRDEM
jgi:hypothetical protein